MHLNKLNRSAGIILLSLTLICSNTGQSFAQKTTISEAHASIELLKRLSEEGKINASLKKSYQASNTQQNTQVNKQKETLNLLNYRYPMNTKSVGSLDVRTQALIFTLAKEYLNKPYLWGGVGPTAYDCSGFVREVYQRAGFSLPRVSKDQSKVGKLVPKGKLQVGDLMFFDTRRSMTGNDIRTIEDSFENAEKEAKGLKPSFVTHVGIYIGNGKMIHASSGGGKVMISELDNNYFNKRFLHARRLGV